MARAGAKCALILVISLLLGLILFPTQTEAYSQVLVSGNGAESNQGPRIFKALNTALIFPRTFNSSDNVVSTTTTTGSPPLPIPYNHQPEPVAVVVTPEQPQSIFVTPVSVTTAEPLQIASEEPPQDTVGAVSTGRAVDYRTAYPFGQLITPLIKSARPAEYSSYKRPTQNRIYSKGNRYSSYNRGQIADRFAPGQGVAAGIFKEQKQHLRNPHDHSHDFKVAAGSNAVPSYVPAKDIYSFPPLNTKYPSPQQDPKAAQPSDTISSYLPPASGNALSSAGYAYPGPSPGSSGYVYPGPVPVAAGGGDKDTAASSGPAAKPDDDPDNDDMIGTLPASEQDNAPPSKDPTSSTDGADAGMPGGPAAGPADNGDGSDTAVNAGGDDSPLPPLHNDGSPQVNNQMYDPSMEYPTPPPGWLEAHPDSAAAKPSDHDHGHSYHDHHHDHYADYPDVSYPELIYDDHHHHHHHVEHPPPPPPPPPTTPVPPPPPPPPPPPEPRVKKYSYFYIGRKLWYIPLYFTVWFSFYILWLIIKSIGRHKVNLPNHYVSKRSLPDYSDQFRNEYINDMTVRVLENIDNFKLKYLN